MSDANLHFIERPAIAQPHGLLLLLHGVGANPHGLEGLAREQDPGLHVILPAGPLSFGPGAYGWFQVQFTPQGPVIQPDQAEASRQRLIAFVAAQQRRLGLEPEQTVIAGFSQGGILSASVGLTSPGSVAGFAILSGRILPEIEPEIPADVGRRLRSALILHGRHDSKLPYSLAERSDQRLNHFQVAHTLRGYPADHELTPAMRQDFRQWLDALLPG
ncbi:alpha/beta hydrolase [Frateuria aurantia]